MAASCAKQAPQEVTSLDKHLQVHVSKAEKGNLRYSITRDGKTVLKDSALGLELKLVPRGFKRRTS